MVAGVGLAYWAIKVFSVVSQEVIWLVYSVSGCFLSVCSCILSACVYRDLQVVVYKSSSGRCDWLGPVPPRQDGGFKR